MEMRRKRASPVPGGKPNPGFRPDRVVSLWNWGLEAGHVIAAAGLVRLN